MPKRANPFGDSSPLQFKSHIGQKEVNMGVLGEENMKAVYEKTKQLLFTGARKVKQPGDHSHMLTDCEMMDSGHKDLQLPPGQLRLSTTGKLAAPSKLGTVNRFWLNNRMLFNPQTKATGLVQRANKGISIKCKSCSRAFGQMQPCQFCEGATCVECSQQCFVCSGSFCSFCSVLNYDLSVERAFCLNCHS